MSMMFGRRSHPFIALTKGQEGRKGVFECFLHVNKSSSEQRTDPAVGDAAAMQARPDEQRARLKY